MFRRLSEKLSAYFRLEERNTTIRTEVLAGLTTFITVAYILILLLTGKARQIKPLTVTNRTPKLWINSKVLA